MNKIMRLMLASAFGALVAVSLGNHVSSNWLVLWGIIGAFVGFVSVGPKEFLVQMRQEFTSIREICRIRKEQKIGEERRLQEKLAPFLEHIRLEKIILRYRYLYLFTFLFWIVVVSGVISSWIPSVHIFSKQMAIAIVVCGLFIAVVLACSSYIFYYVVVLPKYCVEESFMEDVSNHEPWRILLTVAVERERKFFVRSLTLPLWPILHIGFLFHSAMLILAKTCSAIVSFERWTAVIGSIGGFIVGWHFDHNEIIAMFAGAGIGGMVYILSKILMKILPDSQSAWPSLSHA